MSDELFRKLRNRRGADPAPKYTFKSRGSGDSPFHSQSKPSESIRPDRRYERPDTRERYEAPRYERERRSAPPRRVLREESEDRPYAYDLPVEYSDGTIVAWEPPGVVDILKDLGLRMLEVAVAASARAIGEEVAYFFSSRRFSTSDQRERRSRRW